MLIQIHMLQNYAPSNLNRDDTGSPKDAVFGGTRRGRISSQCLKRSIRRSAAFDEAFGKENLLGVRTRLLPNLVRKELEALGTEQKAIDEIVKRIPEFGREANRARGGEVEAESEETSEEAAIETATKQLIFIGGDEVRTMAEKLLAIYKEQGKKWTGMKIADITKALGGSLPRSVDIALFGRMTTSSAFENVEAAAQVAHALSTNALVQEFDYFTAVDDLSGESGAGMIGDVEFNSSTYYKYFNIHWENLVKNLGDDVQVAHHAVLAFLEAAATAQPSGKQNTFAAFNLPDVVLMEVSGKNLPVSYANAFLKPVKASNTETLMQASARQMSEYMEKVIKAYGLEASRAFMSIDGEGLPAERKESLTALKDWLAAQLPG
jgi:CRISPR system Cascade subunit CasC